MAWNKALPTNASYLYQIPGIFTANWAAIDDTFSLEHYGLSNALSGYHRAGRAGFCYSGTTAQIAALTGMAVGAMAWDTSLGVMKRYSGATWEIVPSAFSVTDVSAYVLTNQTMSTLSQEYTVNYSAETTDSLLEYAINVFTPRFAGYFLVYAQIHTQTTSGNTVNLSIQDGTGSAFLTTSAETTSNSANDEILSACRVVSLSAGASAIVKASYSGFGTTVIMSGSNRSFINVHRVA